MDRSREIAKINFYNKNISLLLPVTYHLPPSPTMARLKRWESPRREGRNDKGKGGSARQRQRRKQFQALRKKLKEQSDHQNHPGGSQPASPNFLVFLSSQQSHSLSNGFRFHPSAPYPSKHSSITAGIILCYPREVV
jgi:hypothetical protein